MTDAALSSRLRDNRLSDALESAKARHMACNPQSRAAHKHACGVLPGGNTRSVLHYDPFPLAMVQGEGCRLWDADGHEYLDFLGEFTAGLYGHSDPVILNAVQNALAGGLNLGSQTLREAALAEAIVARFPSMEMMRFANSGTEANLMALALARASTGRNKIMVFRGAYHGGVLVFPAGNHPINVPHDFVLAAYNNIEDTLEQIRACTGELAAVLVEPMLGSGGCIPGETGFLKMLRKETEAAGALLIFDEVMTSRLSIGGLQAPLGVVPDLTTLGKYIGGGMSFGAFGGSSALMSQFDPRNAGALPHAGTFNNNALTMSAGLAGLTEVLTEEALDELNARGDALRVAINEAFRDNGVRMIAAGTGSLLNLHPVGAVPRRPEALAKADQRARELVFFDLLEDGIYIAQRGLISLSLAIGELEIETLLSAIRSRLDRWREFTGATDPA